MDNMFWLRAVLAEIFTKDFSPRDYNARAEQWPGVLVTDCRSLWDCITKERVQLPDRRLSLEAAVIRQECRHVDLKWVKSDQQVADCLTKEIDPEYAHAVFYENLWTCGPDARAQRREIES